MGIFDKLFGRTWQKFLDKGDAHRKEGQLGLALQEYRAAIARFDGTEEEAAALETRIKEVRAALRTEHLERFEQLKSAGNWERARAALDSAKTHSTTDEAREEVDELRDGLARAERSAAGDDEISQLLPDEAQAPGQATFIALLGALPEKQADHYDELGEPFRSGWVALNEGKLDVAKMQLDKALEAAPEDPWVLTELGRACLASDDHERGYELIDKAHGLKDDDVYIKLQLAQAGWVLKKFDVSEQALQEAHDLDETNGTVLLAIGQHGLLSGDYASGIDAMEYLIEQVPQAPPTFLRVLGQLYEANGNIDAAVEAYEGVLKARWRVDPDTGRIDFDPIAALAVARIYVQQKRKLNRAIDLLHAMLSVTEGASAASMWTGIARAWQLKGKPDEAREALDKARELVGDEDAELSRAIDAQMAELGPA